jgi:hypothetical protein
MTSSPPTLAAPGRTSSVRLMDAEFGQCRFILRETKQGAICCGAPTAGGSWCPFHRKLVYVAGGPAKRTEQRSRM